MNFVTLKMIGSPNSVNKKYACVHTSEAINIGLRPNLIVSPTSNNSGVVLHTLSLQLKLRIEGDKPKTIPVRASALGGYTTSVSTPVISFNVVNPNTLKTTLHDKLTALLTEVYSKMQLESVECVPFELMFEYLYSILELGIPDVIIKPMDTDISWEV